MSIEIRKYRGTPESISFGPDGIRVGRRVYAYDDMVGLPYLEQNRRWSWTGWLLVFRMRTGSRKRFQVYESDLGAIEVAISAIEARAYAGRPPKVLEDGVDGRDIARVGSSPAKERAIRAVSTGGGEIAKRSQSGGIVLKLLRGIGWVVLAVITFPITLLAATMSADKKSKRRRR